MAGYGWRGRALDWDPDRQHIEQERQKWVYEQIQSVNDLTVEFTVDPDKAYAEHVAAYLDTGDPHQLALALEYVR